jgi:hypothetical protein
MTATRRGRHQQPLLGVDEVLALEVGQLVLVAQDDRLRRAGLLAVAAEDAAQHVDLVAAGVALAGRDARLVGVLGRLDVDGLGRAGGGAQRAADAALQAVLVAHQVVAAPEARDRDRLLLGILDGDGRAAEVTKDDTQPTRQTGDTLDHVGHWLLLGGSTAPGRPARIVHERTSP